MSLAIPSVALAAEDNAGTVTSEVYGTGGAVEQSANDINFSFESKRQSSIEAIEEYQKFFKSVEGKSFDELTTSEKENMDIYLAEFTNIIDPVPTDRITTMAYDESTFTKQLEFVLDMNAGVSASHILDGLSASNTARSAAITYAAQNGFGTVTWDNPADALRHFSWNFIMGFTIGVADARTIADNHELALIGAKYVATVPVSSTSEKIAYATDYLPGVVSDTRASFTSFTNTFDGSSIMDLCNNSAGRKYSLRGYSSSDAYLQAFNDAYWTDLVWYNTVSANNKATAYSVWQ